MQKLSIELGRFGRTGAVLACVLVLGACSSVPDWANPVEWYQGASDWISGEDEETAAAREASKQAENVPPGADRPFPSLSTVPERPPGVASRYQRRERVESGLVADREQARHKALRPAESPAPGAVGVRGAPPPPTLAQPPAPRTSQGMAAQTPPPGNQAFQTAIQQQAAAGLNARRQAGPVRRNVMPLPGTPRSTVNLKPPPGMPANRFGAAQAAAPVMGAAPVATVHFANGSDKIAAKYAKTLRSVVDMHRQRGGTVRVVGHASSRTRDTNPLGHQLANFRISLARAKAVARQLVRYGAAPDSIVVNGVADNEPIYQEIMPAGEAGNRRAEIFLDY